MRRYSLFRILELIFAIAFAFAVLTNGGGHAEHTSSFKLMPADDVALSGWFDQNCDHNVSVQRSHDLEITLTTRTPLGRGAIDRLKVPDPPWQELGYLGHHDKGTKTNWWLFSTSPYLWGFGISGMLLLAFIRRRYIRPVEPLASS